MTPILVVALVLRAALCAIGATLSSVARLAAILMGIGMVILTCGFALAWMVTRLLPSGRPARRVT